MDRRLSFVLTMFLALTISSAFAAAFPSSQTPTLATDEAQTVYLINLQRRARGVGPLRANRQLTEAARWFSWDSVENEPSGFCGHTDSQGKPSPGDEQVPPASSSSSARTGNPWRVRHTSSAPPSGSQKGHWPCTRR